MSLPEPATQVAYLISAGYGEPRWTKHVYVETREVTLPSPDGDAYEFIFACAETGEERRWGTWKFGSEV